MAKNKQKRKPKKLSAPTATKSESEGNAKLAGKIFQPRVLSTFAFGLSGLLAGLATGLNHFPALGHDEIIPKMMLLSAYLGDPHVDMTMGVETGFAGLIMGACLGFSALSEPKDMALSILLSVAGAVLAITTTGNVALGGIAFAMGHTPAILAYLKLKEK